MDAISKESCFATGHLGTGGYVCLPTASTPKASSRAFFMAAISLTPSKTIQRVMIGMPAHEWTLLDEASEGISVGCSCQ